MRRFRLSLDAESDLRSILRYTEGRFGSDRALSLHGSFQELFETLAESPFLGRARVEIDPPGASYRYVIVRLKFVVVYRYAHGRVFVARIIHGAQNLRAELNRRRGEDDSVREAGANYVTGQSSPHSTPAAIQAQQPVGRGAPGRSASTHEYDWGDVGWSRALSPCACSSSPGELSYQLRSVTQENQDVEPPSQQLLLRCADRDHNSPRRRTHGSSGRGRAALP